MTISTRVGAYLDARGINYRTISHDHANSSLQTSITAQIPPDQIAKAVILEDHQGHHLMAVLPADRKLNLHKLESELDVSIHLVSEKQVYQLFNDCDPGAVPALGQAYNMNLIYDEALQQLNQVYLEAGDHETLILLTAEQFGQLMADSQHSRFSERVLH